MTTKDNKQSPATASKPQQSAPRAKDKAPLPKKGIPDFPGESNPTVGQDD